MNKDEPYGEDIYTGAEMCDSCANHGTARVRETAGDVTYCSYTCTKGLSYQAVDGTCIPCKSQGTYQIANDTESKSYCLACSNYYWFTYLGRLLCVSEPICPSGEVWSYDNGCVKCSEQNKKCRLFSTQIESYVHRTEPVKIEATLLHCDNKDNAPVNKIFTFLVVFISI